MAPSAKKRKLAHRIEEISFDEASRHEFLTGFHKRKLQRARHAQEVAEKKAKEEKRLERKKMREERMAEYDRAFEEHRRQLERLNEDAGGDSERDGSTGEEEEEEEEEWEGFAQPPVMDYEAEYIDEDKYTAVTVEELDPSKEGLYRSEMPEGSVPEEPLRENDGQVDHVPKTEKQSRSTQKAEKSKKKTKKKFRYESKEERKITHVKQRLAKARKAKSRRER